MRRQAGADLVSLDTWESYARYALVEPETLDFPAMEEAALAASYTIVGIDLALVGRVVEVDGALRLRVAGTGQELVLEDAGDAPTGRDLLATIAVSGWDEPEPRVTIRDWLENR